MAGRNDAAIAAALQAMAEEADDWWVSVLPILENGGGVVTWVVFRREFLNRYFSEDVRGKKEIEFLELK